MPLYDYQCGNCNYEFEALQGISEPALTKCPECEQSALKKKVSAPAFTFKGSGWYKDLYGAPAPKKEAGGETKPAGEAKKDSTPKSEGEGASKPAKKETAKAAS